MTKLDVKDTISIMPRSARLDAPGVLHHVIGRGIERRPIFPSDKDREDFIFRLSALVDTQAMDIYSWALLPNHFHLLCKTKHKPLAWSMRKLLTGYAVNFNKRYKRQGHLFQNRYKSIVCQEEAYLLELVRYIHLNPLRARLVDRLNELNEYPWSGHSALLGRRNRPWQDRDYILGFFGEGIIGPKKYLQFIKEGMDQGRRPELVGGGLIRSSGGWSEVLSLRKRGEREASDQRILGEGDFVEKVLSEATNFQKEVLGLNKKKLDLPDLASRISTRQGISLDELLSASLRKEIVEARRVLAWLAVKVLGYSGAEVARYLGVTSSCINRSLSRGDRPKQEEYL